MPLGIWTVASRASRPSIAPPFIGMPMTGRVVFAAKAPARWAAMPAAQRMTPKPLALAFFANSAASAGVRWADRMCASKGMSSALSWAQAPFTTGQSLSEPIITATLRIICIQPLFLYLPRRKTKKAVMHLHHGLLFHSGQTGPAAGYTEPLMHSRTGTAHGTQQLISHSAHPPQTSLSTLFFSG